MTQVGDGPEFTEATAPPMQNGEVVFDEPWQSRVFGMAVELHERGVFAWSDFQAALIEEVSAWDQAHVGQEGQEGQEEHESEQPYPYFVLFFRALEHVLAGIDDSRANTHKISQRELLERSAELAQRPHGHDHHHGDHSHHH